MNEFGNKLLNLLKELKENYNVSGVKAEFGEEGSSYEDAVFLKKIASNAGLNFVIKIGGCEALRDITDAKSIGANTIVAPMIESKYALQKFIKTAKIAFDNNIPKNITLGINIETVTGFKNFNSILECEEASCIDTIVLGRTDMALSLGQTKDCVESSVMYNIADEITTLSHKHGKKVIIGGNISPKSIKFIDNLYPQHIDKFETRKIVFDINSIDKNNISEGIIKALNFELIWLDYKKEVSNSLTVEDSKRIKLLKDRCGVLMLK